MSSFVIWIDREHAKIFHFSNEKMERKNFKSKHAEHHTHRMEQAEHQRQEQAFFSEIVTSLRDAAHILILGPGVSKHHFQNYLMEHLPLLAKRIVGCEPVDHPTDPQIAAYARKFFQMPVSASSGE